MPRCHALRSPWSSRSYGEEGERSREIERYLRELGSEGRAREGSRRWDSAVAGRTAFGAAVSGRPRGRERGGRVQAKETTKRTLLDKI